MKLLSGGGKCLLMHRSGFPLFPCGPFYGGGVALEYWVKELKGLLKAELARKNMRYPDLVRRLAAVGVAENEANLRNKISRGNFSGVFLLQCLMAIGVTDLRLPRFPYPPGQDPTEEAIRAWEEEADRPA
jgi:hypothetical protein